MSYEISATIVFEKNWDALSDNGIRYIINEGSSRSSKTFSIIQCFYLYAIQYPNKRLSVWRDTKKECKETVLKDMLNAFFSMPNYNLVQFNKTESVFYFPNGSVIEIQGTDDVNKVHGYQGDIIWFNEPYSVVEEVFNQLDMRNKDTVIIDWNPKEEHWIENLKKDTRTKFIHSTFKDNPYCPPNQKIKILSYQSVKFSQVVIDGKLTEQDALAYNTIENKLFFTTKELAELDRCKENERKGSASDVNWPIYGLGLKAERPNRIFHWNEISLEDYRQINTKVYNGIDWGVVDPMGVLEAKYYDGGLYLHELSYDSENKIREKLTAEERNQIDSTDEGLIMWYFKRLGISNVNTLVCDNNRPAKIIALRRAGFEYAIAANKGAGSIIDGISLLTGLKVYYTHTSKNIKFEQENYSRKIDRYGIVLEEPEDINNHLIDPARYVAEFLRREGIIKKI